MKVATSSSGGNFLTRILQWGYYLFAEVKAELDKVVWPTREQQRLTRIVTIATIILRHWYWVV